MSTGSRITEWRKARGLTQAKLAEKAELSASTIAMYETNRRTPDAAALTKLASALSIPLPLLTGVADAPSHSIPGSATADTAITPNDVTLERDRVHHSFNHTENVQQNPVVNNGTTELLLSREEAKIILFLRMNPSSMSFFESYIRADAKRRDQLNRTWQLINAFQSSTS